MGAVKVLPSDFRVAFSFEEYKEETAEAKEENAENFVTYAKLHGIF